MKKLWRWLRVITALPFRLLVKVFCNWTLWDVKEEGTKREKVAQFVWLRINQPLTGLYNRLWGKDGAWHEYYEIEHWPQWLK